MVVKLGDIWDLKKGSSLRGISLSAEELAALDPTLPGPARERMIRKRREQEVARDQRDEKAQAEKERDDTATGAFIMEAWLASREYQRAMSELSADLSDARKATQRAYDKALERQERTQAEFTDAQRKAITLPDGRRVYFARDGRLMTEDDGEIRDEGVVTTAQELRRQKPDATTWEDFKTYRDNDTRTRQNVERLKNNLERIDSLDARIKRGSLTPSELAEAKREKQQIVESLPPEAREEYERLQAVRGREREVSHRPVDPAFANAPALNDQFCQARENIVRAAHETDQSATRDPSRKPTAVVAPEF